MDTVNSCKCPCCTAPLVFVGDELHCESCGNKFTLEAITGVNEGAGEASGKSRYDWTKYEPRSYEDTAGINLANYSCPSCGAEITGDDTLGATVCPYCGQSTVVKGQFEGGLRPDFVIPFKVDRKSAISALEADFKNAPFLPDEFKNKKKIEEMSGLYVPFWTFDCDCNAFMSFNAERIATWSDTEYNYTKTDHYKLYRGGGIGFANIPVDASKKIDNTYMEAIEPFDYSDAVEFNTAYLTGYLADKYDVSSDECVERANERVKSSTVSALASTVTGYQTVIPEHTRVSFSDGKIRYSLLPVWMLNIKYLGKSYRFSINGQNGKVVGEYPIDKSKKRKYFAKIAGISYAVAAVIAYLLLR